MPQIVTLPQTPVTGYDNLGSTLFGAASEYAAEAKRTSDEERLRRQQLEDVASNRAYEEKTHQVRRGETLEDVGREAELAGKRELIRLGFLSSDKLNAPLTDPAVQKAGEEFKRAGLADRYKGAIEAGDISYADLGDEARVTAGLKKYSERLAQETTEATAGRAGGRAQATDVQQRTRELDAANDQLQGKIDSYETEANRPISSQEIEIRAAELAAPTAKRPGSPSAQEIAAFRDQAAQSLRDEKTGRLYALIQSTKEQIQLNRQQQIALTSQANALATHGIFAPESAFAPAAPSPVTQPAAQAPAVDLAAARAALTAKYTKPTAAPAAAPTQGNPSDPSAALFSSGFLERPTMANPAGRGTVAVPVTPELLNTYRTNIQSELSRLQTLPANSAVSGRVKMLSDTLAQVDQMQRAADQKAAPAAELQDPAVNTPDASMPRAAPRSNQLFPATPNWWAPAF